MFLSFLPCLKVAIYRIHFLVISSLELHHTGILTTSSILLSEVSPSSFMMNPEDTPVLHSYLLATFNSGCHVDREMNFGPLNVHSSSKPKGS